MSSRTNRSLDPAVRNPLLALASVREMQQLPPQARAAMRALLNDLRKDAKAKAERSWKANKGPLACYWKAVSVYAGHTARLLRDEVVACAKEAPR